MQPEDSQTKKKKTYVFIRKIPKRLLITGLLVLALAMLLVYQNVIRDENPKYVPQSASYQYADAKMDPFRLPGAKDGSGMIFDKPREITSPEIKGQRLHQNMFIHIDKGIVISSIAVASVRQNTAPSPEYLKQLEDNVSQASKNKAGPSINQSIEQFLNQKYPQHNIKLGAPSGFTSPNIEKNAWVWSYTATAKDPSLKNSYPDLEGKAVLAIGNTTYYYFAANSVKAIWEDNQQIWQHVLSSIRIDQ